MKYKIEEIKNHAREYIKDALEYDKDYLDNDITDIHHDIFNTDYYIIGYYKAQKWLGSHAFECIGYIKDYENDNFGEIYTDLSSSESVVNMYVYIIGEEILQDIINEFEQERV